MPELQLREGFSRDLPTIENSITIFDNWVSDLPIPGARGGTSQLFLPAHDPRPYYVKAAFGSLEQFEILELGSFEGGHTYQLEMLGAKSVTGIEANAESFVKSLIVKEALGFRARFLYGDFIKYLESVEIRYDLIFACGVLYHMADPLHLLHLISQRTDRVFIWTHYVSADNSFTYAESFDAERYGFKCPYYKQLYTPHVSRGYGGPENYSCHLLKDDLLGALKHFGLEKIQVIETVGEARSDVISLIAHR